MTAAATPATEPLVSVGLSRSSVIATTVTGAVAVNRAIFVGGRVCGGTYVYAQHGKPNSVDVVAVTLMSAGPLTIGLTSPAVAIALSGDQFQPSSAYDHAGRLRIGYYDRSGDPANDRYGYSVATEQGAGALVFNLRDVTTASSDPTREDHLFAQQTFNPGFPHPTGTIGDYSALVATPTGVIASWTDLRDNVCFGGRCGAGQGTYIANVP